MADKKITAAQLPQPTPAELEFAQQFVERAKADGVSLVGPGGLLAGITRTVLETGRRAGIRNARGAKTVQTDIGSMRLPGPRTGGARCGRRPFACARLYLGGSQTGQTVKP